MDAELERVSFELAEVLRPEDLFGAQDAVLPPGKLLCHIAPRYDEFKRVTSADYRRPEEIERALELDRSLEDLWSHARLRAGLGVYGMDGYNQRNPGSRNSFQVGENRYFPGNKTGETRRNSLFQGFAERNQSALGNVFLKITKDPAQNESARRELRNLSLLHQHEIFHWIHLPILLDRFQTGDRIGRIFRPISGYTLDAIRAHPRYLSGVDQRDAVWMLDRVLSCLGYVHQNGLVHGNLAPEHIIVQPQVRGTIITHNVVVCGWSSAALRPAISHEYVENPTAPWCAPEILQRGEIGPWSDLYAVGKLFLWFLGGDPVELTLPSCVEEKIKTFLLALMEDDVHRRPRDAFEQWEELKKIKDDLWERKFRHFDMS